MKAMLTLELRTQWWDAMRATTTDSQLIKIPKRILDFWKRFRLPGSGLLWARARKLQIPKAQIWDNLKPTRNGFKSLHKWLISNRYLMGPHFCQIILASSSPHATLPKSPSPSRKRVSSSITMSFNLIWHKESLKRAQMGLRKARHSIW